VPGRRAALLCALLLAACSGDQRAPGPGRGPVLREGRFGSLRDFVLVDRDGASAGAALFVDRFEATQADWLQFAASASGADVGAGAVIVRGRSSLPVGGMDLRQARAFARWRCGRLPSEEEWQRVTVGGGRSPFPWGSKEDATRANTGDLGLGERLPVGTFESGRRAGGDAPYDLVGNVREWTESVPAEWCQRSGPDEAGSFVRSVRIAGRQPSLAVWADRFGALASGLVVGVGGGGVPRRCVGADFETPMRFVRQRQFDTQAAAERRVRTGLRVYASAAELIRHLVGLPGPLDADEQRQVAAFVARGEHRATLRAALALSPVEPEGLEPGSAGDVLLRELRRAL
jgi:hypothetical protein